jgi:hypothetical protein
MGGCHFNPVFGFEYTTTPKIPKGQDYDPRGKIMTQKGKIMTTGQDYDQIPKISFSSKGKIA